ncbi:tRNA lysidine(34) synthetase TilS [Labilibacter marinus]|uniref:tRNA lysidine(34) synthetase TilS n=1 Tax=Labilibacter marinus TaxID=1477105 RepID=UPI00082A4475|nr:tRNA lysidine(34) synthetase TilS [Labilibacter marinus]
MIKEFSKYLFKQCGFSSGQKVLVALSGGADSIALLHLLFHAGVDVSAAHCNFKLRGQESDDDEQFVQYFCNRLKVQLYQKSFETETFAKEQGVSIEMAARDLRYAWFNELLQDNQLNFIATGHHKDDSIETFFLNLARGTGIKGLSGIKPIQGNLIRPLLRFSRMDIENYCTDQELDFRTDSSNQESVYLRNKLRNDILPLFKELNPSFAETMHKNMGHLNQVSHFLQASVERIKKDLVVDQDGKLLISLQHINEFIDQELVLFEILQPYGFNGVIVKELVECIKSDVSGKQFYSKSHRLIKDRFNLILIPIEPEQQEEVFYLSVDSYGVKSPIAISIERDLDMDTYKIDKNSLVAQFDSELLNYPLTIRKWRQGDQFCPLGMSHFKKLSDFFIDNKFSIKDKEDVWLLLSGDDIIWIVGHRTDDRYKLSNKTKKVTKFSIG